MQFRFLATVIFAIFAIAIFVGGLSIYEVDNYVQEQAESFIKATCESEGTQVNDTFGDMEKSVKIMESYLMGFFPAEADISDSALQGKAVESADKMFVDVAKHTDGVVAYYFRFAPEISSSTAGLFYSKLDGSNEYTSLTPTDIYLYEEDDTAHVGWYWQPKKAGKPIWMEPYYNENNRILMISYVIPMYHGEDFIGVVGMDFDYMALANRVHEIKVYENGFAHLELGGVVIHGADEHEVEHNTEEYLCASKELTNGMTLVLSASYDDIRQIRYEIAFKILFAVLIVSALFIIVAILVVKRLVDPLKKLTNASEKLSNGDYDVEIVESNTHEIRLLSAAFENMMLHLREREELLRLSANRDSLTGLRNTTSYKSWVEKFDKDIRTKPIDFGVAVLDINDLKKVNDQKGHEAGNAIILSAARAISDTFKKSPVFRIGGDEFSVILQGSDLESCEELFSQLDINCRDSAESGDIPLKIARGFSRFDPDKDTLFADVFKRADEAMYENKRKSKADIACFSN